MAKNDYELKKAGSQELDQMDPNKSFLQKFRLYETQSKFYLIGRNKSRTVWRVLKIDRSELTELDILEDSTIYSEAECYDLLKRLHEGNILTGGLKFVTTCYGIIGFVKFLGPYYMLLITKRRQIGCIGGHAIYAISKSEMIPIPHPTLRTNMAFSKNENRYKKLLCTIDLTKDFFFSYSYHVMRSLQKNITDAQTGQILYETRFVWNAFLTRGIRSNLKNTLWTVALVHGFFKQEKLSVSGRDFNLTLIARRSRLYAGTRYRKRGVNERGRVANDVETEQIVFEDLPEGGPVEICSVVQHRGSIPLFWSQETSRLNIKPDIVLSGKDQNYRATRIHFDDLRERYGNPIIVLNLIKTREKKRRESKLRSEFAYAIEVINKDLSTENRLRFLHLDLNRHFKSKGKNVLELLGRFAEYSLGLTGFFHSQLTPDLIPEGRSIFENNDTGVVPPGNHLVNELNNVDNSEIDTGEVDNDCEANESPLIKQPKLQNGVLRTNCIDCLDRTNVAQYSYGLAALGHQLHALGLIDSPKITQDNPLALQFMGLYEIMGDTIAFQYGGSAAHNKIFSLIRGHWMAAIGTQEFFRSVQRYYNNAYMDAEKQDAINIFLGYFQPQQGNPALWELDSDQHFNVGRRDVIFADENARLSFKRSLSDGNIVTPSDDPMPATNVGQRNQGECSHLLDDSTPEICDSDISLSRFTSMASKQVFTDMQSSRIHFQEDSHNCSNFVDVDWLSSAGNSCAGDLHERYEENVMEGIKDKTTSFTSENDPTDKSSNALGFGNFSDRFVHWVSYAEAVWHTRVEPHKLAEVI
ncbi:hypothetical protein MKW98_024517 [Papaver atlanticum]|uniref:SAC domain-containing protein n=2 Tax=Papaver TaxID=3468 RepID=A0AAD4RV53_9MAGN|nr:hypothetical protein MKW98_024517 [Papaver atlanticum]